MALFGWSTDMDTNSKELLNSRKFRTQAAIFAKSLDTAIDMLGPNTDMVS